MALNNLFKEIEFRIDRDSIVLNLGVFLGLASLFIFSYIIFLIGVIFILIIFARATFRKILLLLFGFGLVHASLLIFYYCYERTDYLWAHFYVANVTEFGSSLVGIKSIFILGAIPLLYFVFSLFMLTREARFTKYQSQLFQVIFLWLGIATIQACFTSERTPHSFFTFIPPFAYFISHCLLLIRRRFISESMLWILIIGLIAVNLLSKQNVLKQIEFADLFPRKSPYDNVVNGKNVVILGNDLSLLQHNKLSGYFLDWQLSKKYFDQPDLYENVIKINKAIMTDQPDVIIDETGMMFPFVERIPSLQRNYRKENNIYWRR